MSVLYCNVVMDSDSGQHFLHPDEEAQSTGNESLLSLQSEVVHFLETPKRKPCALAGGHRYLFTKRNEYDVVFWRCEKYFKEKCRGGIATSGNRVIKVTAHVCVPDPSRVDIVKALHVCRRRAREDVDIPISRIVAEEFTPLRDRGLENVPSYLSLKSSLHRERQKHLANRPDPGDFLEVEAVSFFFFFYRDRHNAFCCLSTYFMVLTPYPNLITKSCTSKKKLPNQFYHVNFNLFLST